MGSLGLTALLVYGRSLRDGLSSLRERGTPYIVTNKKHHDDDECDDDDDDDKHDKDDKDE